MKLQKPFNFEFVISCRLKSSLTKAILSAGGSVDLKALQNRYSSPLLQPLLPLLACPIENAMSTFITERGIPFGFNEVPSSDEASFKLFDEIAQYVDR